MKRVLIFIPFFVMGVLFSQGRRANQPGIHTQYGFVFPQKDFLGENMIKLGYNRVIGDQGWLGKVELFYQNYNVFYRYGEVFPYQKYAVNVSGGYSYEKLYPVFLNGYIGAYGGYERVNNGSKIDSFYGAEIPVNVSSFTFGALGSFEIELVLARRFSLLVDYTQYMDFKSRFSKSNGAFFTGFKYYIN